MQDCNAEGQSAWSQVSGGAGVLVKAAGLDGGAEAEMVAALVVASPVGAAGAAAVLMPGVWLRYNLQRSLRVWFPGPSRSLRAI